MDERKRVRSAGNGRRQPVQKRRQNGNGRPPVNQTRTRTGARRSSRARRRRRNRRVGIFLFVCILLLAAAGALFWMKYGPSKEKADLNEYYGISGENDLAIVVDNQVLGNAGRLIDGIPYIEYSVLRDNINSRFYWDSNENIMLYTLPNGNVSVEVGEKDYTEVSEKKSEDFVILKTEGQTAYVALSFVQQYANIDFEVYKKPNRVMIVSRWGKTTQAEIKKPTQVRYQAGVKSPILRDLEKGETVTVIEPLDDWKKVRTSDGMIGYVKANRLKNEKETTISREFTEPEYKNISKDYTINMAWHNVTNTTANSGVLEMVAKTKGLTTIAPTWYSIADTDGNLNSISSADYVNYAKQTGLEVWAVLRDFHGGVETSDEVYEVLSYTSKRTKLINQVIGDAIQTGVQGINLDFEHISTDCGEHYIQFVRELSVKCRQNGLVLSVDNYVPMPYNEHYDIKEQGVVADYVVMMGYDEHTNSSYEAGSVASYSYEKDGIENMLEKIPAKKLISAIPFYTRLWTETDKTEEELKKEEGTEAAEYSKKISSQALGMDEAAAQVEAAGVTEEWDKKTRQNYAEWETENGTCKIWLEDSASIEEKLKLIKENKLAGVAEWRLGYENAKIWDLILQYVN